MTLRSPVGDLQLAILRVLWRDGEANAAAVHQALLAERGLALTTISTMLKKMEPRGLVVHRSTGRQFIWRAAVAEDEVNRTMVGDLVQRLFQGDSKALVSHLLTEGDIASDDLAELQKLVQRAQDQDQKEEPRDDG